MIYLENDYAFMQKAIALAKQALPHDIPIGCIILDKDQNIIGQGYNTREKNQQIIEHAEIVAIRQANIHLNNWRLDECTMYVTLEPCLMCTGAIIQSRISRIVFGAYATQGSHHHMMAGISVVGGILETECMSLLRDNMKNLR